VRQELREDVQLADATGDQLCVLASEVEDDDRIGRLGQLGRRLVGRSLGMGGVERLLQVRLDLGVVGREHPMAGVRRLAVDGAAALRPGRWAFSQCRSVRR
jgi:hypothetical protein